MDTNSWLLLDHEAPEFRLPDDLRARDPLAGRDCGWVEQMRPFVRQFSAPGERVLDPFCGFGTTLLAAHLEGRAGLGYEVDAGRAALARARLARHGVRTAEIVHGSVADATDAAGPVHLCLTSVPYFGCGWTADAAPAQLYRAAHYEDYLARLRDVFHRVRALLAPGRHCIAMAENLVVGGRCLPLAFDLARLLGGLFTPKEERIVLYRRERAPLPPLATATNRSHEYALVFEKARERIDLDATVEVLRALAAAGFEFAVHGSFARWWRQREGAAADAGQPADADLLVRPDETALNALLTWLQARDFRLLSFGEPVSPPIRFEHYRARWYFRAERLDRAGRLVRLDLGYALDDDDLATRIGRRRAVDGIPLA